MDAYLAAFAMAAWVLFVSLDRDFSHFEQYGLKFQLIVVDGSGGKAMEWKNAQGRTLSQVKRG